MRFFQILLSILFLASSLHATVQFNLDEFDTKRKPIGLGASIVDGSSFLNGSYHPDFDLGPLTIGLDFNLFLGANQPRDFHGIVLRNISYTHNDIAGFKWGHLNNVTYGQGLLVRDYDSASFGTNFLSNQKTGGQVYVDLQPVRLEAMYTATELAVGRATFTQMDSFILGAPIVYGATWAKDMNGIDASFESESIIRDKQEAWAFDVAVPIGGDFLTGYIEHADLIDQGSGTSLGFKSQFFNLFSARIEYRRLSSGFVPEYFNETYEATSFDFASQAIQDDIEGGLIGASMQLNKIFRAGLEFEAYQDVSPILTSGFGWSELAGTSGVLNFRQTFTGVDNAILSLNTVLYNEGPIDYLFDFKRIYYPNGDEDDIFGFSARFSPDLLSSLF